MHIVFVCTGNTCRSPMAAFLARAMARQRGLNWTISSAGVYAPHGQPISHHAKTALMKRDIDATTHQSQPVTPTLVQEADLILTMTSSHQYDLLQRFPEAAGKVHTLGAFVHGASDSKAHEYDIVDPFGGMESHYSLCADHLEKMLGLLFEKLERTEGL